MIWFFDPLHRTPRQWRAVSYLWLAIFFARLACWYGIEQRWGQA